VAAHWRTLAADAPNDHAWRMFHQAVNRFTADTHTVHLSLERLTNGMEPDAFADLMERFEVLYDVFCPAPERKDP
jgi:hypothetical protein